MTQIKPWRRPLALGAIACIWLLLLALGIVALFQPHWLEQPLRVMEAGFADQLAQKDTGLPLPVLIALAFGGGVLGSISPCILALLPLNLAYIGTLKIENRKAALLKAALFVLGVVLINSLLGLLSGFAQAVTLEYKGWLYLIVGGVVWMMAASVLGWLRLPLPQAVKRMPDAGPFVVGMAFALVSSPCASPVLFGVLALAATAKNSWVSVAAMAAYGLGYTLLIFFASLFTGLSKQLGLLQSQGVWVQRLSAGLLLLMGIWAWIEGLRWFLAV